MSVGEKKKKVNHETFRLKVLISRCGRLCVQKNGKSSSTEYYNI